MTCKRNQSERDRYLGRGIGIGIVIFVPLGLILFAVTGSPTMLMRGGTLGLMLGLAIGEGLYRRRRQAETVGNGQ
jgi:hypothetical protein